MRERVKSLLRRVPYIKDVYNQYEKQDAIIKSLQEQVKKQGFVPPGHFYSIIPSEEDILSYIETRQPLGHELMGIELNKQNHLELLEEYVQFYKELPFPEKQMSETRYYYENDQFSYSDAIFLFCFLRKHQPKKIIEIGSGFSSAVMLDTADNFFSVKPEITFIEPYPDRLMSLLRGDDQMQVNIIDKKIKNVATDIFLPLQAGDFLFIDSSHVLKYGSDVELLIFEIIPRLAPGVFVHFHDIFYSFDYPIQWVKEGRYWNEGYIVRAFLSYNCDWSIYFFNQYAHFEFSDLINEKMPLCVKNDGGSIYIQKNQKKVKNSVNLKV
jgi:hypothetical protein